MTNRKPVAAVVDELMVEMQRAKQEVKVVENEQTRLIAKFKMPEDALPDFEDERPTKPGKKERIQNESPSIIPRHPESEPPEMLDDAEILDAHAIAPAVIVPSLPEPSVEVSGMVQKKAHISEPPPPEVVTAPHTLVEPPLPTLPMQTARWPKIVLAILTPAAIIVAALALLRHFGVPI